VILHELVTGRRMDLGGAGGDARHWPPLPAPSSLRPGLPRALDAVVAKATRFGPRGRYATAGELFAALDRATAEAVEGAQAGWLGDWVDRARHSSSR
jgi:serine/threonine-protein kinase